MTAASTRPPKKPAIVPKRDADEQRAQRGEEPGANRDASAVQQSRQHVTAEPVGAEQRDPRRRVNAKQVKPALDARQHAVGRPGNHHLHREIAASCPRRNCRSCPDRARARRRTGRRWNAPSASTTCSRDGGANGSVRVCSTGSYGAANPARSTSRCRPASTVAISPARVIRESSDRPRRARGPRPGCQSRAARSPASTRSGRRARPWRAGPRRVAVRGQASS